ncbi:hypothetical protein CERSUDRAFT_98366 [Gelatoporia subvermispora B]|uniref:Zn(2)-C6 fungal-type domain-containing protein n=1 Tax=Ceriporiopsis subvermispora (strain B) TaxID=914234 RepID=M2PDF3_CERS8|nr:hypothetical protein CERSUDRAFT_98366 [Gelatoporia subvermispora B]
MSFDFELPRVPLAQHIPPNAEGNENLFEMYTTLGIPLALDGQFELSMDFTRTYNTALDHGSPLHQLGIKQVSTPQSETLPEHVDSGVQPGFHGDGSGEQQSLLPTVLFPSFGPIGSPLAFGAATEGIRGTPTTPQGQYAVLPDPQYDAYQAYGAPPPPPAPASILNAEPVAPSIEYYGGAILAYDTEDSFSGSSGIAPFMIDMGTASFVNIAAAQFDQHPFENYPYERLGQLSQPAYMERSYPGQVTMSSYQQPVHVQQDPTFEYPQYPQCAYSDQPLYAEPWMDMPRQDPSAPNGYVHPPVQPGYEHMMQYSSAPADFYPSYSPQVAVPPLMPTTRANIVTVDQQTVQLTAAAMGSVRKRRGDAEGDTEAQPEIKSARHKQPARVQATKQAPSAEAITLATGEYSASPTISDSVSITPSDEVGSTGVGVLHPHEPVPGPSLIDIVKARMGLRFPACAHCHASKKKCDKPSASGSCTTCLLAGVLCVVRDECKGKLVHCRSKLSCTGCREAQVKCSPVIVKGKRIACQ